MAQLYTIQTVQNSFLEHGEVVALIRTGSPQDAMRAVKFWKRQILFRVFQDFELNWFREQAELWDASHVGHLQHIAALGSWA